MKLSLTGCKANAERELALAKEFAETQLPDGEEFNAPFIEVCISAYHDCLLALLKGDETVESMRDFLLTGKTESEIMAVPYCGDIVIIGGKR